MKRVAGDAPGATKSLKRPAEELELANLVPPVTLRLLALGIGAEVVAAIWSIVMKLLSG